MLIWRGLIIADAFAEETATTSSQASACAPASHWLKLDSPSPSSARSKTTFFAGFSAQEKVSSLSRAFRGLLMGDAEHGAEAPEPSAGMHGALWLVFQNDSSQATSGAESQVSSCIESNEEATSTSSGRLSNVSEPGSQKSPRFHFASAFRASAGELQSPEKNGLQFATSFRSSVSKLKKSDSFRRLSSFVRSFEDEEKVASVAKGRKRRNTGGYHPKVDEKREACAGTDGY
jgi:hypothetical protein